MNNSVEVEEFLKYYARIYKQNPNLPIVRDTIYHGLATYGISDEEKQDMIDIIRKSYDIQVKDLLCTYEKEQAIKEKNL